MRWATRTEMRVKVGCDGEPVRTGRMRAAARWGRLSYEARCSAEGSGRAGNKEGASAPLQMALACPASNADFTDKSQRCTARLRQMAFFPVCADRDDCPARIPADRSARRPNEILERRGAGEGAKPQRKLFVVPGRHPRGHRTTQPQYVGPAVEK
ncbi:hypothetical protein FQR65_LT20659 [Abscondita terminalis]|nr:hypothetical protein FQR65_LT20659 [Abscondita terminalis]